MQPEVVFVQGPPFSGKVLFYCYHFSQTHEKINPGELFEADPSLSLRAVILKVVNVLNKGQSVVVDDDNTSKKTRKSYLTVLRSKVPQCRFRVLHFEASDSSAQLICQWAREWELAHQFEHSALNTLKLSENDVEEWFETRRELVSEEEGFSKIDKVDVQLVCDTPYKFTVPALFLQWEGTLEDQEDQGNIQESIVDVVNRWSHSNTHGRVIVLKLSEKHACNVTPEESCGSVDKMKQNISKLVSQVTTPVFFVHLCLFMWQFNRPPNPGLFACLQRLHSIDLSNRATFYIYSSDAHLKAAGAAGVKCIKANKLFHNPQMINAVHCGVAAQVPEYVSKAKLAWFGSHSRPEACLPLFREAVRSCEPASHDMSPQCVIVTKDFFVHGVCFKDFATLDRFNTQYKHVATPTKRASDDIFNYYQTSSELETCNREKERNIQCNSISTEVPEASIITSDKSPVCTKVDEKKIPDAMCPSLTMKHLAREVIERHAFSSGHFRRGEGCAKLIRNVKSTMVEDGIQFIGQCIGSQGQFYDVSVVISQKGVERAVCSCADPASKLGRCKHGVGLLLWCKNEKNMEEINKPVPSSNVEHVIRTAVKRKEAMCDVFSKESKEEVSSTLRKDKSLPKWISSLAQSASHDGDRVRRPKTDGSLATLRQKRFKSKKSAESTLYCLSPDELLHTAQEIIEECRSSSSDHGVGKQLGTDYNRSQPKDSRHVEQRSKQSSTITKEPCQRVCNREKPDSSVNTDVLNEEAIVRENNQESLSNCPDVGLIRQIIPETVAVTSLECYSKKNDPSIHESLSKIKEGGNCLQETHRDITNHDKHGPVARTSILDEFI